MIEQETFFDAVMGDAKMKNAAKIHWLHATCAEYWARLAQAETDRRREWEVWFQRVTALRLALIDVINQADATEPCSVSAARLAQAALDADDAFTKQEG